MLADRHKKANPEDSEPPKAYPTWLHCSVGAPLEPGEELDEESKAQVSDATCVMNVSQYPTDNPNTTAAGL